jgi:hypothetical protein
MNQSIGQLTVFMDTFTKSLDALVEGVALVARDEVAQLLSQFNELVPACDERLQACAALLAKGLRDESLGYESDDPPLLETVTLLDLSSRPQWPRWLDALRALGFPEPQMPKVEVAVELREAQEQVVTLKPLLDQWRRANLANAPLASRIELLRRLRKDDPNNEAWYGCLQLHEKQRAMEIEADAKTATKAVDEQWLASLDRECKGPWLEPPSRRVRNAVEAALLEIRGSRIGKDIEQAAASLAAAYEARDIESARGLRRRWNSLLEEKGAFDPDDPYVALAMPCVEWMDRHDRLETLFSEVWQSLDTRPATSQARSQWVRSLVRMRDEVEDLAEKLQDDIDLEPIERLRSRVARLEIDHQRELGGRRRVLYVSVGSAAAVVIAAVATFASVARHQDAVRKAVAELTELRENVDGGQIDPDGVVIPSLTAGLAEDPAVSAQVTQLTAAVEGEQVRRKKMEEEMAGLQVKVEELAASPRAASLEDWPEVFVLATRQLVGLSNGGLIKTDADENRLANLRTGVEGAVRRFQSGARDALNAQLRRISDKLVDLRKRVDARPAEVAGELASIEEEVASLRELDARPPAPTAAAPFSDERRFTRGDALPLARDGEIARGISAIKDSLEEWQRLQAAEERITEALGDWPLYAERLKAAATEFPKQAISRDYSDALKDEPLWRATAAWNGFIAAVGSCAELEPAEARTALDRIIQAKEGVRGLGFAEELVSRLEGYVAAFAERDLVSVKTDLMDWTEGQWLGELPWCVRMTTASGREEVFCCRQKPDATQASFPYIPGAKDANGWPKAKYQKFEFNGDSQPVVEPSPQRALAEDIEKNFLGKLPGGAKGLAWDDLLVAAIDHTLDADRLDPCPKARTLMRLFEVGVADSAAFERDYVREMVAGWDDGSGEVLGLTNEEWGAFLRPGSDDDQEYVRARKRSKDVIDTVRGVLAKIKRELSAARRDLSMDSVQSLQCVGRLARDQKGAIEIVTPPTRSISPEADLFVLGVGGKVTQVGRTDAGGRAAITTKYPSPAGTPVFAWKRKDVQ